MSSAHVEAIGALEELRNGLLRFKHEAQSALDIARMETNRTKEWLQERLFHWQKELNRRERILQDAQISLNRCQSKVYRDSEGRTHVPDCSAEQAAIRRAQQLVAEAEMEMRNVHDHAQRVDAASSSFEHQSFLLTRKLDVDLQKATQLLDYSVTVLTSYIAGT